MVSSLDRVINHWNTDSPKWDGMKERIGPIPDDCGASPEVLSDAAYAFKGAGNNRKSMYYFTRSIEAYRVGPGLMWRIWYREDDYHAPRSYLDIIFQYRFRLSDADRAEGLSIRITNAF